MIRKLTVIDNDVIADDKKEKHNDAKKKWILGCVAAGDFGNDDLDSCFSKKDFAKAIMYWTDAAIQGSPQAQCELAWCYAHGFFVEKNIEKAMDWYKKSLEQNFFSAYLELVSLCFENKIDSENSELIVSCLKKVINILYKKIGSLYMPGDIGIPI